MDVSVITVTYNSARQIDGCLSSVRSQQGLSLEAIVVDNNSSDETLDLVRRFGPEVKVIANRENVGFGRACNQGAAVGTGRYFYFLNPDAQLVRPDSLVSLCRALEEHPKWGMTGNVIRSMQGEIVQPRPHTSYPGQKRAKTDFSKLPGEYAWVLGSSMLFRREVFERLKGFDPDFFLYSEETDICLRVRKLGYEIGFTNQVEVRHIGGASEHDRDPYDVWTNRMNGLYLFWTKHHPRDEARRLVRHDQIRSVYRMCLEPLQLLLRGRGAESWDRLRQWQATWAVATKFLSRSNR